MLRRPKSPPHRLVLPAVGLFLAGILCTRPQVTKASDWTAPAAEMAKKISGSATSPAAVALTVRNLSSLNDSEAAEVRRALRTQVRALGIRLVGAAGADSVVRVTLSENSQGYLWVAEIRRGDSQEVKMVSVPRDNPGAIPSSSETLVIRKAPWFSSDLPILDLAPIDSGAEANHSLLVLHAEKIVLYKRQDTDWSADQSIPVTHPEPLPRDLRGELHLRPEGTFDAFLPGLKCSGSLKPNLGAECRESDEPWPLDSAPGAAATAHFAANRNYFDGAFSSAPGQEIAVPPFFAVARLPNSNVPQWIFAGVDGRARLFGKGPEPVANFDGWGSGLVALKSGCGSGWQLLATQATDFTQPDALQAYDIANRKAVATGAPVEFSGPITAFWPGADGASAVAVVRDLQTRRYETFTLSITCGR